MVNDASVPSGAIIIWSGASDAIPSGYVLCNGQNGTPDLRDRFIIGAGSNYSVGATGGSSSHTHSVPVSGWWSWASMNTSPQSSDPNTRLMQGWNTNTGSASTLPPYYALCYIMKTYPVEE